MWVRSRPFTGRIVSVANCTIFDEAIFNYSRNFPFIWEEIAIPISSSDDRVPVEETMLHAASQHTPKLSELSVEPVTNLQTDYYVGISGLEPRVFYRVTDNWLERAVRFIVDDRKVRGIEDAISRELLRRSARPALVQPRQPTKLWGFRLCASIRLSATWRRLNRRSRQLLIRTATQLSCADAEGRTVAKVDSPIDMNVLMARSICPSLAGRFFFEPFGAFKNASDMRASPYRLALEKNATQPRFVVCCGSRKWDDPA